MLRFDAEVAIVEGPGVTVEPGGRLMSIRAGACCADRHAAR